MAVTYAVADGHDVADVDLNDLSPQPRSEGIQSTQRTYAVDGSVFDQGDFIELIFDFREDATEYQATLTAFGVNAALTNEVTVRVPSKTGSAVRMNGIAVQPEVGRDVRRPRYFFEPVVILVKDLSTAS